jgi:translation elongation factor EF-G
MDRMGAKLKKVLRALREKLNHNAVLMQIPIGAEENFAGVVDLVTKKLFTLMVITVKTLELKMFQLIWWIQWKSKEQLCLMKYVLLMMM